MSTLSPLRGTLFLVRHGETPLSGTYCGSTNPPLSARGRRQARSAARALSRVPIDVCFASPLRRAQQTAAFIHRGLVTTSRPHAALKELHFGDWEGLRFKEIAGKWPALSRRWAVNPAKVRIPHGETFASLRRRARRFLALLQKRFSDRQVLIVAHGGLLSALLLEHLGLPDRHFSKYIAPLGSVRKVQGRTLKWIHR